MISFDPRYGHLIADRAGVQFNEAVDPAISRLNAEGELRGGVVFNGFNPGGSIQVHMAGSDPYWVNRDMLWLVFDYAFVKLGVKKLFAPVPSWNAAALEINRRLGFKEETRVADVFADGDLVVLSMRREECRWLRLRPPSWLSLDGAEAEAEDKADHGRESIGPSAS